MVEKQEGKVEINDSGVLSKDEATIGCLEEQREITDYWDISGAMDPTPGGVADSRGTMKLQDTAVETMADDPNTVTKIPDIADNVTSSTADTSNTMKIAYCDGEKCAIKLSTPELSVTDNFNSNNNNNIHGLVTQGSGTNAKDLLMCKNSVPFSENKGNDNADCNVSAHQTELNTVGTEVPNNKGLENDVNDTVSENILTSGAKDNCPDGENKTALSIREEMMLDGECREERFRIDRKKLEQMLQAASEGRGQSGEVFFQKIMDDTSTFITWPSKLKIGAKSKKDPHIRICGKPDNIREARQRIMLSLDTKSNRVTVKMDVSHTEHSHVIGKGGNNIKRVMQETGCHIHFPDSNRNSAGEKSNQVSITGHPEGVESARQEIRSLLPIVLQFEIPNTGLPIPDLNSPMIQHLVQVYGISIQFKQRMKVYSTSCTVRGSMDNANGLKKGVQTLMTHVSGAQLPVTTQIEIAPQHHNYMLTKPSMNVTTITQTTGVRIIFPDPSALPKKSTVYITGTIDAVILARLKLIGCLPLLLMFDMKDDTANQNNDVLKVAQLMETLDVSINIKSKPKQPSRTVIIKSIESNIYNMFEARAKLLGLESSAIARPAQPPSPKLARNATITPSPVILVAHSHVPTPTVQTAVIGLTKQKPVTPLQSVVLGGPGYILSHNVPSNRATPHAMPSIHTPSHSPFPTLPNGSVPSAASNLLASNSVSTPLNLPSRLEDISSKHYQLPNSTMSPPTVPLAQATSFNNHRHYQVNVASEEMQRHINQTLGMSSGENVPKAGMISNSSYIHNQGQYPVTSMQNGAQRRSSQDYDFSQKMYSNFHGANIPKQERAFENNRVMLSPPLYDSGSMCAMAPLLTRGKEDQFTYHDRELEQKMNEYRLQQTADHLRKSQNGSLSGEDFLPQQLVMAGSPNSVPNSDPMSQNRLIQNNNMRQPFGQNVRSPDSIGESRASVASDRNSPLSSISERYNGNSNPRLGFDQFDDQSTAHRSSPTVNTAANFQSLTSTDLNSLSPLGGARHHRSPPQIVLNQNLDGNIKHGSLADKSAHLGNMYTQQQNDGDISSGPPPGFESYTPAGHAPTIKTKDYENLSKLAKKAMENKPVPSEVRTPTDIWSGWGFSKSMPFEMKEELNKIAYSKGRFRTNLPTTYENGEVVERTQPYPVDEDADYGIESQCPNRWHAPHADIGKGSSNLNAWRRRRLANMNLSLGGNMGLNHLASPQKHSAFTPIHPNESLNRSSNSPQTNSANVNEAILQSSQAVNSPFSNSGNESTLHLVPEKPKGYEMRMNMNSTPTIQDSLGLNASTAGSMTKVESDIPDVLNRLGLSKYIPVFQQQEVDYQTFLTLTEPDLKELGITTFGPRKKIILAIKDLNKDRDVFSGPTANDSTVHENISDHMLQLQRLQLQHHRDNPQTTASSHLVSHSLLSPSRQLFNKPEQQSQHMQNRLHAPALNRNRLWQNSGTGVSSHSGHW